MDAVDSAIEANWPALLAVAANKRRLSMHRQITANQKFYAQI